ncbi:RICIN domain-containing protein [Pseudomonas gingeri]|uniref:RICIN domain-containing protein n=1 Tax=Pseudomonas gingeri TaxID=117681 RepID=A0A7Y7WJV9_9PSED|nr:RICIN domain-containing protein [Pseudomonas gingeri]NWB50896.1 RICIN domain-containing protein [Pseudomonas gingeri]
MQKTPSTRDIEAFKQAPKGASDKALFVEDGIYKIYAAINNGASLVDMAISASSGRIHNVKLFHDNSSPESTWKFTRKSGADYYVITNQLEKDLVLGVLNDDNVVASPITGGPEQAWLLYKGDSNYTYYLQVWLGKVMDVVGSGTANNTNIIVYPPQSKRNQMFGLTKIG